MRLSEFKRPTALAHAGEVAHWTVMLLGWVWLGEQGLRLGWPMASGVLAVAVWWAARLLCRGSAWALHARPGVLGWWGLLTACGIFLPALLPAFFSAFFPAFFLSQAAAHTGLLALALVWGVCCGLIETRSQVSTFQLAPLAWHPVLAAGLVAVVFDGAWWGVSALLAACAAVLHVRDLATAGSAAQCRGPAREQHLLAPAAMGLMMGSLWLGNAWCVGLGLSKDNMVLAHLVLMACLPSVVAAALRGSAAAHPRGEATGQLSLLLLAVGALMLLGDSAAHGVLAMVLPSLAWALHCNRPRTSEAAAPMASRRTRRGMALLLGPALLVWVGVASPWLGPWAVKSAMALLGTLAAVQALYLWRTQGLKMRVPAS